jgi:hypothetical protein
MKIVVFDLDETLGYFTEFGIFWDSLINYSKVKNIEPLTQLNFDNILDLYPEFLRPNIINILNYLKNKKQSLCCHKMMIYTNNNGPKEWAHHIIDYFSKKINYKLFDQLISAFKINGKIVEVFRTTHDKTYNDFIKCTKLPTNSEICFLDDTFYPEMANDNIYYINIKPYYHYLKFEDMIDRFKKSEFGSKLIDNDNNFENLIMDHINLFKYMVIEKDEHEYEVDKIIGKHIISHLQKFFSYSEKNRIIKNRTIKNRGNRKNKTIKQY